MRTFVKSTLQVLIFIIISYVMNRIADTLHVSIPGSILGLGLVFVLLQTKVIKLEWLDLGAKWLLAEMLLFFIPPAAGMIQYKALLLNSGFRIVLVVVISTVLVMVCAGLVAEWIAKPKENKPS
ncbi:CidA/LrgA family holin-like protein [Paenibacillus rigui]|uniref:Holin n=1 Tax=Paenibacillus rigui TaxID=554312 RepID=A0A229USR7_9BACL|nr:CidA/LrgA family holin-like protein [Paenibacillus rigui]OXM86468.1 holin [Paenibacillus rigui]